MQRQQVMPTFKNIKDSIRKEEKIMRRQKEKKEWLID